MKYILISCVATTLLLTTGCTKLDETIRGDLNLTEAQKITDVGALLKGCYNGLRGYQTQDQIWCLQTLTTDEGIPPTRGGDWDDNGVWRVLHNHSWTAENDRINGTFTSLLGVVFSTTNLLNFKPTAQQAAEAKFIRAFVMYTVLDVWNQVPYRQPGEDLLKAPQVLKGADALNFIITELTAIIPDLPDNGPTNAFQANKNAARALLMKCYLNKGTIVNRQSPTFDNADMAKVIALAGDIGTSKYSLASDYFTNFAPDNGETANSELIFTSQNIRGTSGGNMRFQYHCGSHYNQNPSGWNGFTTLSDFYDKYQAGDKRLGGSRSFTANTGWTSGFQIGQQYKDNGVTPLKDRNGNPLSFTRNVKLVESGPTLEVTGIRVAKYIPDYKADFSLPDQPENDYVLIRYADVVLMKAEAQFRSGDAAGALLTINPLRVVRGATPFVTLTLNDIYDERGREFYWEGNRRSDMIRFGKFLAVFQEKPTVSDPKRLLFPIPSSALAVNPNLTQNPGY